MAKSGRRYPRHGERAHCGNTVHTGSNPVYRTKIEIMERNEMIDFLRENLRIGISMDDNYEGCSRYANTTATLYLGDEEISSDYDSVCIEND